MPEAHEMLDHFERHGKVVKAVMFDGGDCLLRGAAEISLPDADNNE